MDERSLRRPDDGSKVEGTAALKFPSDSGFSSAPDAYPPGLAPTLVDLKSRGIRAEILELLGGGVAVSPESAQRKLSVWVRVALHFFTEVNEKSLLNWGDPDAR